MDLTMVRINEKTKCALAVLTPMLLIGVLFVTFAHFRIRVFYGERSDALNILNGVVQGLSTIVAIVFSIIIVTVQTTLGKYVARAIRYVLLSWRNILVLCLYISTISCALGTMWIISYQTWVVWVDVTMTASVLCLIVLLPFFLQMSQSLNPSLIMNQVKEDILDACDRKDFKLMAGKTNLLFSMIKKAIEIGDVGYAFEGLRFVEEVIRLENARENRWMYFNLVQSLLDNLGMESLRKHPNVTLRIFEVYTRLIAKMKSVPVIFANITRGIVRSVMDICSEALPYRFVSPLLLKAFHMIIDIYKSYVLLDYYVFENDFLDQSLHNLLGMSRGIEAFEAFPIGFTINHAIMELLKNEKAKEALHMLEVIHQETTGEPFVKLSLIGLIIDSKSKGFDDFASKSLEIAKKKFAPFKMDVLRDPSFGEGKTETSVKPDGSMEIKTGDKKIEEASLWIKRRVNRKR